MNTTMPAVVYSPDDRWGNQIIYFDDSVRESILDGIVQAFTNPSDADQFTRDKAENDLIKYDHQGGSAYIGYIDGYRQSIKLAPDPNRPGEYLEAAG